MRFDLAGSNDRELPLILGLMPVLPKHAIDPATFEDTTFAPPVGSGPYVVANVDVGKSVTLKRDPNYWGGALAVNRGQWNFDELRFDYYRDANSYFEAFKTGLYDVHSENDPSRWRTGYDIPAVRDGRIVKEAFPDGLPKLMLRLRLQHQAADLLPTSACAKRSRSCSTSSGSTTISSSTFIGAVRASFDGSRALRLSACGRRARARAA